MIWRYLKPYWIAIAAVMLLTFGQVFSDLSLPDFLGRIVDRGIAAGDTGYILRTGAVMLVISLFGVACAVLASYLAARAAYGVGRSLRASVFSRVTAYSLTEIDKLGTASLITRTTNDITQVQFTVFMMLRMLLRAPLMCIGGIVMAIRRDGELSLVMLGVLPIVVVVLYLVMSRAMPLFRQLQRRIDKINLILRENLVGMRVIRAFSRVGYEKRRFSKGNDELTGTALRIYRLMAALNPAMILTMNLLTAAIIWVASLRIDRGSLMVGDMMAFIQYAMMIFMALMMLTMMFVLLPRAFASGERIKEVLSVVPDIKDPVNPQKATGEGRLEFRDVTFRYEGAERCAVCGVSFEAAPGQTIAIIGGTGAGKSTLVNLIPRFYDIGQGEITIDGVDIRRMTQHDLREKIGFIPQQAVLFSGTVEENVRFGKQDATGEEIRRACEIAQASEFIDAMPEGYDSPVAQGGTNLSGGQKQRLAIARAIVKRPQIYIFDDSFSALDFRTDAALQAALRREVGGATVVIVAQRVSSIVGADRILVMENGRVVGAGTHKELYASNGVYRQIVDSQLSDDETL